MRVLSLSAAAEREIVPDDIEKPNYSDLSYVSNSWTENPLLPALHLQHVHVRDVWAVICRDVVGRKCRHDTLLHRSGSRHFPTSAASTFAKSCTPNVPFFR